MAPPRVKAVVAIVVGLALVQILFDDALVFLGATGALSDGTASSPYVLVVIPLVISLLLLVVLVGGAIRYAETLR